MTYEKQQKVHKTVAILTPVYMAWERVEQCCSQIDANTHLDFVHILIDDSSPEKYDLTSENRVQLEYDDQKPPDQHRANITKALQMGYEYLNQNFDYDYLFIVESDVMVPLEWDIRMIELAKALPLHVGLEAFAVNENMQPEYPMNVNPPTGFAHHGGHDFQIVDYCDFNCILIHEDMLEDDDFAFDRVPSHHDILLSRYWKEKFPGRRCFRTQEVNVIHYPNSSRSALPQGMNTPSNT